MLARRADFYAAFEKDYRKPAIEVDGTEFMPVLEEIRHTIGSLKKWAQPKRVWPTVTTLGTTAWVESQPRGRVLIHEQASPSMADGGLRSVESMTRAAPADGISLRTGHRVQRLVVDGPRVAGV